MDYKRRLDWVRRPNHTPQPTTGDRREARSVSEDPTQVQAMMSMLLGDQESHRTEEVEDSDRATKDLGSSVARLLSSDGFQLDFLSDLGFMYRNRFERSGELSDLDEAIAHGSQAVSLAPHGHPNKPGYLSNLGLAYSTRSRHRGDVSDASKAIVYGSQAVLLTPDGHPNKAKRLTNLGVAYTTRFRHRGDISDLNEAIARGSQAVLLTPDGHPDKPEHLSNLGGAYGIRFERLGEISDLNEAIAHGLQAASLAPDEHPDKARYLSNLGTANGTRFERLGEISDLDEEITCGSQAVLLTPDGHPNKPGYLSNLGLAYTSRFERLGEMSDLNKAIAFGSQAVLLTPNSHPSKPGRLSNLALAYMNRFQRLREISDLNKAIESGSQAVELTPDGHPRKPVTFYNLGLAYVTRFRCLASISDLESAVLAYTSSAQSPTGSPSTRFRACREWAQLSFRYPTTSPHPAYLQAMELLPLLVWVGTTLDRRYELTAEVGDFSAEAASHAISVRTFDLALEWLEAGRSIVWGQMTQLRSPFDQLASHNPKLADKLRDVGCKLEQAGSRTPSLPTAPNVGHDLTHEANNHINLALEWDRLLKKARSIPGFEDFLRPPKSSRLLGAAQSHPIAVIHCQKSSCDALILKPNVDEISHIHLPEFSHEIASAARRNLGRLAGKRGFRDLVYHRPNAAKEISPPNELEGSLEHLWSSIVKPILHHIGFEHDSPTDQLPHITWCTTGILSFLPLHAAGCYDPSKSNIGTFDRVTSSYTPTLSALLANRSQTPAGQCRLLMVGQKHAQGLSILPYVTDELNAIQKYAPDGAYLRLESAEATTKRVLEAMDQSSWLHMACHGTQNPADPRQSAFHLRDGPLTLATIASRPFTNKGLAFLSACQTATGDEKLPDEAIHLAAGMLMAGFPSVIGTMWSIMDKDGPEVADRVYAELLKDGKMDHTRAAEALHQAVSELRKKVGKNAIERWAPFIHIGS